MRIPHDLDADPFPGSCPYHGDCWEGLAAGPALEARWGRPPRELVGEEPVWRLEAHYVALGLANVVAVLSPERIVLGGGVMEVPGLFELVRAEVDVLLAGYVATEIVPPALGRLSGVLGAIALALSARP
jgi:fructokinase